MRRGTTARRSFASAVLAAVLVACGEPSDSDKSEVSEVIVGYNEYLASCLSGTEDCDPDLADRLAVDSALEELLAVVDQLDVAAMSMEVSIGVTVREIAIDGDSATAEACGVASLSSMEIQGQRQDTSAAQAPTWAKETYELRKTESGWRVSSIEPGTSGSVTDGTSPCD